MAQHTVQFRPLDLNDTISEAAQLVMNNAPAFLGAMLLANLPLLIWQALVLAQPEQWTTPLRYTSLRDIDSVASVVLRTLDRFDVRLLAGVAIAAVVGLLQAGAATSMAARRYFGRAVDAGEAVAQGWQRLPALVTAHVIPALIVVAAGWLSIKGVAGIVACGVVLVIAYPLWLFATPVVMIEGRGGLAALWRSVRLARHAYGYVLAVWLVLELLLFLAALVPFFLIGMVGAATESAQAQRIANIALGNLAAFLIVPFRDAAIVLLYYEVRRRKEGRALVLRSCAAAV